MPANPRGALQLRLHAAATPDRVLEAAKLFHHMVRDAYPDLPTESITMVVHNRDMVAGMRWQDSAGRRAIDGIIRFALKPDVELIRHPQTASALAHAVAENADTLTEYGAELWTPRRKLTDFSNTFVETVQRLASTATPRPALRGATVIYTQVYKVGRANQKATAIKAKIDVDGRAQEVQIRRGADGDFFDAAKSRKICAVHVDAAWFRTGDGNLVFDARRSRLVKVEPWSPISGADLMQRVEQLPADALIDLDEFLDDIEGL